MSKHKRLYSLFEEQNGEWVRISKLALPKESAVRTFQNALLAPYLYPTDDVKGLRELRVVTDKEVG